MKILDHVEAVFTVFFVAMATAELTGTLLDRGEDPRLIQVAGLLLMLAISAKLVLRIRRDDVYRHRH